MSTETPQLLEADIRVRAGRFAEGLEIFHDWAPEPGSSTDLFDGRGPAVAAATTFPEALEAAGFDPVAIDSVTGDLVNLGIPDFDALSPAALDCLGYVAELGSSFLFEFPGAAELSRFRWSLYPGRTETSWSDVDTKAEASAKANDECDCCPCCDNCDHDD